MHSVDKKRLIHIDVARSLNSMYRVVLLLVGILNTLFDILTRQLTFITETLKLF